MSGPAKPTERTRSASGAVCAKCGQVNPRGANVCQACEAHLHVVCHSCGQRNPRSRARCGECGQKLHRSWSKRLYRGLFGKDSKISLLQIILLILGITVALALIVFLSKWSLPSPDS